MIAAKCFQDVKWTEFWFIFLDFFVPVSIKENNSFMLHFRHVRLRKNASTFLSCVRSPSAADKFEVGHSRRCFRLIFVFAALREAKRNLFLSGTVSAMVSHIFPHGSCHDNAAGKFSSNIAVTAMSTIMNIHNTLFRRRCSKRWSGRCWA